MRFKVKISEEYPHRLYLPKEVAADGFTGDVNIIVNGKAIVIVKPETTLNELEASLNLVINSEKLAKAPAAVVPIDNETVD